MKRRVVLITSSIMLAAALVAWGIVWRGRARAVAEMFGGEQALETVAHPGRVEAYRLDPLPEGTSWQDASLNDFPVATGPVEVSETLAGPVSAALLSTGTYAWNSAKGCAPSYGARISFVRGADRIDVLFCFECDILLVGRNGRVTGGEDFDHARPVFDRALRKPNRG